MKQRSVRQARQRIPVGHVTQAILDLRALDSRGDLSGYKLQQVPVVCRIGWVGVAGFHHNRAGDPFTV